MKKSIYFILSTLTLLTLSTACTQSTPPSETTAPIETTSENDKFAVNVTLESNSDTPNPPSLTSDTSTGTTDTSDQATTEAPQDIVEQIQLEESEAAQKEIALAEEESSKAYDEYIHSDAEEEIYLYYDKEDTNYLYFTDNADTYPTDYKINKSSISGETEALSKGNLARITFNGAIVDGELIKVYSIANQTAEDEAESLADENEEIDESEFLAELKAEGIDASTLETRVHEGVNHHEHNSERQE